MLSVHAIYQYCILFPFYNRLPLIYIQVVLNNISLIYNFYAFLSRYDPYRVARRLPFVFFAIWVVVTTLLLIVPVSTVQKYGRCLVAYRMFGTFLWDAYAPYTFVLSMAIPLTTMCYCYVKMFKVLNDSKKTFHSATKGESNSSSSVDKLRVAQINIFQTCVIMVVFFLVSWLSSKSALFLFSIGYYKSLAGNHYTLGNFAILANSCVNPFIYALRYDEFKQQALVLMKVKTRSFKQSTAAASQAPSKI